MVVQKYINTILIQVERTSAREAIILWSHTARAHAAATPMAMSGGCITVQFCFVETNGNETGGKYDQQQCGTSFFCVTLRIFLWLLASVEVSSR